MARFASPMFGICSFGSILLRSCLGGYYMVTVNGMILLYRGSTMIGGPFKSPWNFGFTQMAHAHHRELELV